MFKSGVDYILLMAKVLLLNGKWKFKWFEPDEYWRLRKKPYEEDYDDSAWLECNVPGDVHTYLLEKGLIEDPFFEKNAEKCRWVEEVDWWFKKVFYVSEDLKASRVELVFEGLDTFATVWLNGIKIAEHEDMFLPLVVDVTDKIRFGEKNILVVKLGSPLLETRKRNKGGLPINLLRAWARKAQYAYGWDWATRLLTVGIWRDVKLVFINSAKIRSIYVRTLEISNASAKILIEAEVEAFKEDKYRLVLKATCKDSLLKDSLEVELKKGLNIIRKEYSVEKPYLWWPRGYGEQNLYELTAELYLGESKVDEYFTRFGIRTIELVTEGPETPNGKVFYFKINGVKVFVKGANWIPLDLLIGRITSDKYEHALRMMAEANHNAVRVWGGGLIEHDMFYDLCDELGIMVWQDFPYSTAYYPTHEEFLELVKKETESIVKRLRNHPSIILWCGNNEIDWMMYNMGIKHDDHPIFYKILPEVIQKYDPGRPYWPSSPWGGKHPNSMEEGNRHNWYVWHRYEPIEKYLEDEGRFITEFGFQAAPDIDTLKKFIKEENLWPISETWIYHYHTPWKMAYYIREFGKPLTLRDYVLLSQLVQAYALKIAIEHYRSRKFACGGCMYWNFNAPWPNICWEVVDYFFNPKAAYFYVKKAYSPIILVFKKKKEAVEVYVVNDALKKISGKIALRLIDFNGKTLFSREVDFSVEENSAKKVHEVMLKDLPLDRVDDRVLIGKLYVNEKKVHENTLFFAKHFDLKLPETSIEIKVEEAKRIEENTVVKLTLSSSKYSYFTYVKVTGVDPKYVTYSDNYFNIVPGEPRPLKITIRSKYIDAVELKYGSLNAPEKVFTVKL